MVNLKRLIFYRDKKIMLAIAKTNPWLLLIRQLNFDFSNQNQLSRKHNQLCGIWCENILFFVIRLLCIFTTAKFSIILDTKTYWGWHIATLQTEWVGYIPTLESDCRYSKDPAQVQFTPPVPRPPVPRPPSPHTHINTNITRSIIIDVNSEVNVHWRIT